MKKLCDNNKASRNSEHYHLIRKLTKQPFFKRIFHEYSISRNGKDCRRF